MSKALTKTTKVTDLRKGDKFIFAGRTLVVDGVSRRDADDDIHVWIEEHDSARIVFDALNDTVEVIVPPREFVSGTVFANHDAPRNPMTRDARGNWFFANDHTQGVSDSDIDRWLTEDLGKIVYDPKEAQA